MTTPLSIAHHFAHLQDPRVRRAQQHKLSDILVLALCATLADCDSWYEIEDFGNDKIDWFRSFLELPNGIPSHDTFNRVFAALDPQAFQDCFTDWINAVCAGLEVKGYQIDGKAQRGSADRAKGLSCLHTVSVWANEHSLSLGQVAVDKDSNEIPALPKLLRLLELAGALVSIDAIGCQKEIAQTVLDQGGDYLLAVKDNQPTLYQDLQRLVEEALAKELVGPAYTLYATEAEGHGRQERRTYLLITDLDGLSTRQEWPGLKSVVVVTRERTVAGQESVEQSYYISSRPAAVEVLAQGIREHWGIENRLHWVLDVAFGEDQSRARAGNAQENLAWLRRVALSLLRQDDGQGSIKRKRKRAARNNAFLEQLLDSMSEM
jgi:predicted transposase YbfD/YdcC